MRPGLTKYSWLNYFYVYNKIYIFTHKALTARHLLYLAYILNFSADNAYCKVRRLKFFNFLLLVLIGGNYEI